LEDVLIKYHLEKLKDREDLERAAGRKDVLFYHFAFEIAMDHFLQALFAINRTFFPSRKRTHEYIVRFDRKPANCYERLLEAIRTGAGPDGLAEAYAVWDGLVLDLLSLAEGDAIT